ncbi:hypothetical protein PIB30_063235 [Stylosanthes scabra]|uniref:Receptor-like serine/threonine-protein kinase n=1 Tax=Stylosanthes scabra TaxID=79078 RepID=A0ABU6UN23_9FABA|nr:hypothetical protein [Stylosanthes scabra]
MSDGDTLVSADETFALGFFSPGTSKNRYVGIWYNKDPTKAIVWVANREKPLTHSSGVLKVNSTGILVLLDSNNTLIWSSNTTRSAQHPVAKLLNSGNFVVQDDSNSNSDFLWQSFDYPGNTILPGQKFGRNLTTGLNWLITSWKSSDDPSQGSFSYQFDIDGYPQFVLREGAAKRFRFGSWNGIQFSGAPQLKNDSTFRFIMISNEEEVYYVYWLADSSVHQRLQVTSDGFSNRMSWSDGSSGWGTVSHLPVDDCDYYGKCGAYASCDTNSFPMCNCLDGFVQNTTDPSSGCVRRTSLSCNSSDGFVKFSGLKLPDTEGTFFNRSMSLEDCRILCLNNCSCMAYAALDVSKGPNGCLLWFGNLIDMKVLSASDDDIYTRMAGKDVEAIEQSRSQKSKKRKRKVIIAVSCVLSFGILILCLAYIIYRWKMNQKGKINEESESGAINSHHHDENDLELPLFDMCTITSATSNFSSDNILGTGGFGSVYKGVLEDGQEVAVKRLSKNSSQGHQEFKNEVLHVAKLQHRNLVRLLGCCIQAGERMLVYEFMRNKSLDYFIFDSDRGKLLGWPKRFHIINGIARGLLYLHQDSRHRMVHRDLKAGNVLLDDELNPRISDFGLARRFVGNENEANTKLIVGTYGYLSPEYIVDGLYSTKSDVYSFGVSVLEIVSGKRNRGFIHIDHNFNLLGHAWTLFTEGKCLELVDALIKDSVDLPEVLRSIHVGLLCVQRNPEDRPSMSYVLMMLSSEWALPQPKKPGFFIERDVVGENSSSSKNELLLSVNGLTVTQVCPR